MNKEEAMANVKKFLKLLQTVAPVLYTIEMFNATYLKDMEYGEIHITEFVKNGKVVRIEVYPKVSKIIQPT